jgi:hypothetical protein
VGVGVALSVAVGVGVGVADYYGVAVTLAVGVGVAVALLDSPPSRPVERCVLPIWWPNTASSDAVTTAAPITAASRPVMTASLIGNRRRGFSSS